MLFSNLSDTEKKGKQQSVHQAQSRPTPRLYLAAAPSEGVELSEVCWSAVGIYMAAIRWEMKMEVLNLIHKKISRDQHWTGWLNNAVRRQRLRQIFSKSIWIWEDAESISLYDK